MNHEVISFDSEAPTTLDTLIGMVSKTADENFSGYLRTLSVRMPSIVASRIEGLTSHSGQSRNKIAVKLIEVGLEALWNELPSEEREVIEQKSNQFLSQWIHSDADKDNGEV